MENNFAAQAGVNTTGCGFWLIPKTMLIAHHRNSTKPCEEHTVWNLYRYFGLHTDNKQAR
jgi:hypothetical protein